MSELRFDQIRKRWVIIAPERRKRPFAICRIDESEEGECPFCEGKENLTPPETFAIGFSGRKPDTPGWRVRVVPNKFPALKSDINLTKLHESDYFLSLNGFGYHEVIIETPVHNYPLWERKIDEIMDMFVAINERIKFFYKDRKIKYVLLFGNYGKAAGASLSHPHSQIVALPTIPEIPKNEMDSSRKYYIKNKRCLICNILKEEIESGARIVERRNGFIIWEPFASSFPFETWIIPENHECDFSNLNNIEFEKMAFILKDALLRINKFLKSPPFNLVLHTSCNLNYINKKERDIIKKSYHWHLEIISRMTQAAGFEWGTGININPIPPEEAAECLREVKL
ncbi:galactose-1-phosphate uridylyltransferase [Candidatus Aminicenantes bacterium AC-335-A11]|jgi:UDPglucose--hexose-1-phosphate uridylyltransferase|nr:galactose-1-phosphate uridylyltransferase [SCandidatus Aminicenantes bacterium Aminicenantia_JdfR_composite]MCP2596775.1 galactose-1-phosphate uridylyltransferase [Candidatus Aminicenantes bacterium AC-335-G13]MCP2605561.1 galactose-1-phosphate uridylyltransferase [Candidatus Aminicenantes bacterium AC-335-O07]MCP2617901.1 galactose-1-phosphate uridylyltransferase [Candidatus Aminicenantes bacterium AC-335-A11]